jgi:hypothetical protein
MAAQEGRRAPLPVAQALVVCREIFEDCRSGEFALIAPLDRIKVPALQKTARVSIYAHWSCGHGEYELTLELRDPDERVVWQWQCPKPIRLLSPLEPQQFTLYDAILQFAEPGRHNLLLLVNGEELARHGLQITVEEGQG